MFLINIPLVLIVLFFGMKIIPEQPMNRSKKIDFQSALLLMTAILLLIYSLKSGLKQFDLSILSTLGLGLITLFYFSISQKRKAEKFIDFELFKYTEIKFGFSISFVAMTALVGFELLISQEMQFVYDYSPLEAGLFILPFMIAIAASGLFSSHLLNRFGNKRVSVMGVLFSAIAMYGLSSTHLAEEVYIASFWMAVLGISILTAFLAATSAILSAAPVEKATSAGAIEGMSYELGTGLGVAIFGLTAAYFYQQHLDPALFVGHLEHQISNSSLAETLQSLKNVNASIAEPIRINAKNAFSISHGIVLKISALILVLLAICIQLFWTDTSKSKNHIKS